VVLDAQIAGSGAIGIAVRSVVRCAEDRAVDLTTVAIRLVKAPLPRPMLEVLTLLRRG
jgi:hypothetical protein